MANGEGQPKPLIVEEMAKPHVSGAGTPKIDHHWEKSAEMSHDPLTPPWDRGPLVIPIDYLLYYMFSCRLVAPTYFSAW